MQDELKRHIEAVEGIRLDSGLSDNAVEALAKIYVALHNLVVSCNLDDRFGDRRYYGAVLDKLYHLCRARCAGNQSFDRRCRMMPTLYHLLHGVFRALTTDKSDCCDRYVREIMAAWFGRPSHTDGRALDYEVLRCIVDFCYEVPERYRNDRAYTCLMRRISSWTAALNEYGEWTDVPAEEALRRIDILGRYAYMHSDEAEDRRIERLYDRCHARIVGGLTEQTELTVDDCRTLSLLYDVAVYVRRKVDDDKAAHIVRLAQEKMRTLPEDSDAHLICRAVCIDWLCMQQAQAIQERIFSNIA